MRFKEARAWFSKCPRCEHPIVEAHVEGVKTRLSTKAVPFRDAMVLGKYRIVVNIHIGESQFYASQWVPQYGKPDRGWLFAEHICGRSKYAWK